MQKLHIKLLSLYRDSYAITKQPANVKSQIKTENEEKRHLNSGIPIFFSNLAREFL